MVWTETEPTAQEQANTIHTLIQNTKVAIRERFEVDNGTMKEHTASDSDDAGKHPISKVGFCKIVDTWSERPTTDIVEGGLIYVKAPEENKGLYRITPDNKYLRVSALSHTRDTSEHPKLSNMYLDGDGNEIDNHVQYAPIWEDFSFQSDITVDELIIGSIPEELDAPIPMSHASEDFYTAHGPESVNGGQLKDVECSFPSDFDIREAEGIDVVTFPKGSTLFLPWTKAPDDTPRAVVIGEDSVRIMDKDMNNFLTDDGVTIHIWYIPPEGETW